MIQKDVRALNATLRLFHTFCSLSRKLILFFLSAEERTV